MKTEQPIFIVGIGGSAGGLNAYKALLDALADDTDMAFVVISHMSPSAYSQLAQILSRHTKMPVVVASMMMPVLRNHVYVIPANSDLFIVDFTFKVLSPRSARNKQIDLFFGSLAEAMGEAAIGIVFSGYDRDGTKGCEQIKAKGGITFAQDKSAEIPHMPMSAEASGFVDFVMSPGAISDKLNRLAVGDII